MATPYYRLKIKSLKFISAVDAGAQGPVSNVALIKRAPSGADVEATCRVFKVDEKLGLVFGWALATTLDGGKTPHIDLQKDAIIGGDELIKVAAEFMEASAASDVLHDDKPDGKIVFAMPLTKDVKAALGVTSDIEGLAIAMKPSPETFKRFVAKELNAFSIGGTGEREVVKGKRGKKSKQTYAKMAVLTSSVEGHQHSIDLDAPADPWSGQLSMSYQTEEGAEEEHCHPWVYDATTGKITIGDDSGHTHEVTDVVPAHVLAAVAAREAAEHAEHHEPTPEPVTEAGGGSGGTTIVIAARAPEGISTPSPDATTVKSETKEPIAMADTNDRIRELEAANARLEKMSTLTDAQRAHFAKLSGSDAQQFLNLAPPMRDAQLAEIAKADSIVYTSPVSGKEYRKSCSPEILELVQQADAATMAQRASDIEKRNLQFAKRGDETLAHFTKGVKGELRGRIMKALDAEFKDATEHEEAVRALKAADFALAQFSVAKGVNPHTDPADANTPLTTFTAAVADFAKRNNMTYEVALERGTATDPEIRRLYNEAQRAGN